MLSHHPGSALQRRESIDGGTEGVGNAVPEGTFAVSYPPLNVLEIALPPIDLLHVLHSLDVYPKVYWKSGKTGVHFAAFGTAVQWKNPQSDDWESINQLLQYNPTLRVIGGRAFWHHAGLPYEWSSFPSEWWFLPRILLEQTPIGLRLLFLTGSGTEKHYADLLRIFNCYHSDRSTLCIPKLHFLQHQPEFPEWFSWVLEMKRRIASGAFRKIVLSRRSIFALSEPVKNGLAFLRELSREHTRSTLFAFQPDSAQLFFGATPEHLYIRRKNALRIWVIAGTIEKTGDFEQDQIQRRLLLQSSKNRYEHQLVVIDICDRLRRAGIVPHLSPTSILELPHLYHLVTPLEAEIPPGWLDNHLLDVLHPTPAVGGFPWDRVQSVLWEVEGNSRGWYAAPIGWISADESEIAVAIRSALFSNTLAFFYTGAGIVLDSDPVLEWQELDTKLHTFRLKGFL